MRNALRVGFLLLAVSIITALVIQTGPSLVWASISQLGWLAPLALLPYALVYLLDTLGWRRAFKTLPTECIGFWRFAKIRWASEATNYVIPTAYVGGEALKVYLLSQRGVSTDHGAMAAVTSKTCQTLAQVLFLALGVVIALQHLPQDSPLRLGMMIATALFTLVFLGLLVFQQIGFYTIISLIAAKLGIATAHLTKHAQSIRETDRQIRIFCQNHPRSFLVCTGFYFLGWLADTIEIWLISHLLQSPISWPQAIAIEAFISVAKILGMFVPGSLGVQESGVVGLCYLFGLPIVFGTSYALLRRVRELGYASIGLVLLYSEFPNICSLRKTFRELRSEGDSSSHPT
ncbi:MAG: hypothetical protein M2R45_00221 [Verrucomicrobia subdivision 3 bacterium]|nr:hypothetical protein [Limisphaerales bacterium]MCS1412321.1 hypothetical protein [Limisphaerales bacterium]